MIDTHTHIYTPEDFPGEEPAQAAKRAIEAGVDMMILPCCDVASLQPIFSLNSQFPDNTRIALGLHPTELTDNWGEDLKQIMFNLNHPAVVAIGEIGLDLHEPGASIECQKLAFARQIQIAAEREFPIIIHQRDALLQVVEVLEQCAARGFKPAGMVFHCFTSGPEDARLLMTKFPEAYFGIGGVSTFKNARELRDAIREIGLSRIVLETDSPYLAPVPRRGRRNESAYIPYIASSLAETLSVSISEVDSVTTENARRLFPALPD